MTSNNQCSLRTNNGIPIYPYDYIENLRDNAKDKKTPNNFSAQKGAQESGLGCDADIIIFGGNRGGGKANPYSTPVATPSGFRKMGDLEIGDPICTP